ncbi:putative lipid II flippase FtsW [Mobilicoccus pelagius]|uniref:Probable peptidoglycan glycosyltransferase FtsW n=1 Tax=Mobilicoccus pelagius NBRC 104925 TaxID=1089455 RepID=H5UQG5_9MICO|nr:putative lipid II flippase FtsW [Mobilicoccus pelagius]GAB47973.1 cell division protein FtsW [Mobilicoccus pelagius NBRC 104925]
MSTSTRRPTTSAASRYARGETGGGAPPDPHPFWVGLESPLSTYYLLIAVISSLTLIGLVVVLSSSSVTSLKAGNPAYSLFMKQAQFAVLGTVGAFVASRLPVSAWKKLAFPIFCVAVFLQLLVHTPVGVEVNGNRNWIQLPGMQLQPSEIGKFALVLCIALGLATKRRRLHEWQHVVVPALVPFGAIIVGLTLLGRDLGTALILLAIIAGLLWAAGVSWKLFVAAGGLFGALAAVMVLVSGNRMSRIDQWLNCTDVHQCWQTRHGQFALADGGILGRGLGNSVEKWLWLPEPQNDFIYAIIGEELGLWGALLVLALYALLALACYRIVMQSDDQFVRLATTGVMVWILVQAMINIGSVIGLLPVIGVPLPLVSYGGSALVTNLGALGMVISFARSEPACRRALAVRPVAWRRSLETVHLPGLTRRRLAPVPATSDEPPVTSARTRTTRRARPTPPTRKDK